MVELMPRGGSECCTNEQLIACCDPLEKDVCCGAQADRCDCAEGAERRKTIIIARAGVRSPAPQD